MNQDRGCLVSKAGANSNLASSLQTRSVSHCKNNLLLKANWPKAATMKHVQAEQAAPLSLCSLNSPPPAGIRKFALSNTLSRAGIEQWLRVVGSHWTRKLGPGARPLDIIFSEKRMILSRKKLREVRVQVSFCQSVG